MGLCLLVYSLGQRFLRKSLEEQEETIRHQSGKRTNKPTLRWVFQMFQAVHLLVLDGQKLISNLTDELQLILSLLPPPCRKYYLII